MADLTAAERRVLDALDETGSSPPSSSWSRVPSVTGTDAESDLQHPLARWLRAGRASRSTSGRSTSTTLRADPDFPGTEAPRSRGTASSARHAGERRAGAGAPGPRRRRAGRRPRELAVRRPVLGAHRARRAARPRRLRHEGRAWPPTSPSRAPCTASGVRTERPARPAQRRQRGGRRARRVRHAAARPQRRGRASSPSRRAAASSRRTPARSPSASRSPAAPRTAAPGSTGVSALEAFWPRAPAPCAALEAAPQHRPSTRCSATTRCPTASRSARCAAGDWASSVPDLLVAEGRMGVRLEEDPADARAGARGCRRARPRRPTRGCATTRRGSPGPAGSSPPGRLPEGHPLVDEVGRRARRRRPAAAPRGGGAPPTARDLRLYAGVGGIPTLHYGPGDVRLAHAPGESVPVDEVVRVVEALVLTALRTCGTA